MSAFCTTPTFPQMRFPHRRGFASKLGRAQPGYKARKKVLSASTDCPCHTIITSISKYLVSNISLLEMLN
jgi:hypothetical protein